MSHGWVVPNSNGSRARCGGPKLCSVCQREQAEKVRAAESPFADFEEDIRRSINRNSLERFCNMPDYVIAEYLRKCFENLCRAVDPE